jgi:hypothetical protein
MNIVKAHHNDIAKGEGLGKEAELPNTGKIFPSISGTKSIYVHKFCAEKMSSLQIAVVSLNCLIMWWLSWDIC